MKRLLIGVIVVAALITLGAFTLPAQWFWVLFVPAAGIMGGLGGAIATRPGRGDRG